LSVGASSIKLADAVDEATDYSSGFVSAIKQVTTAEYEKLPAKETRAFSAMPEVQGMV
jgi:hypothetical protein